MRSSIFQTVLGTSALFIAGCDAGSFDSNIQLHRVHRRQPNGPSHSQVESNGLVKRGTCAFPTDDPNLVSVTPNQQNGGWAMSPDQPCKPGSYCPIACKPGMVMNQWDPNSKYTYPASMNGGLFCDNDGNIKKPFPDKPNCVDGTGTVKAVNKCKGQMSWCQTVLPGNEAMLIPTLVTNEATIAVPGTSYWQSTSAHFYINPPGVGNEGCIWGSDAKAVGNWAPYVAGANTDNGGQTFVKIGWNPVWQKSNLAGTKPTFGLKIECPNGGCNGLPCQIDPSGATGSVDSKLAAIGAGDAAFCVVTVAKGSTANIVAFDGSGGNQNNPPPPPPPPPPASSTVQQPTPTPPPPATSSSPPALSTTATSPTSSIISLNTSSLPARPTVLGGIFQENGSSSSNTSSTWLPSSGFQSQTSFNQPTPTDARGDAGRQRGSAIAGLLVAFVAAAYTL